jgi:putative membrane protein
MKSLEKTATRAALVSITFLFSNLTFAQDNPGAAPTDPEIAHIVVAANNIDIEAGKLARSKSKDKEVQAFANHMVTDHTGVNQKASDLTKKLAVTPKDNDVSRSLMKAARENIKKLNGLEGRSFDKAYIDQEVGFHQTVINSVDKTLIPNAKNAELKQLIQQVRPSLVAHLEYAKKLQTTMAE